MKAKYFCSAVGMVVALGGASQPVSAQSSVTLYGVIDAGVTYFSNLNGHGTFVAQDGSIQSNRWGLLGSEDLGGGTKIIFQLENGFNLYSGTLVQPGVLFSRQSWIGVNNARYGSFKLGKQFDFFWDNLTQFAMGQYAGQYSWHPGDFDHLAGTLHINNALKYASSVYRGLSVGALYAFPSSSVSAGTGRVIAFGARYDGGPFQAGVAYTDTHDLGLNAPSQAGTTLFPNLPAAPLVGTSVSSIGAGASYRFGPSLTRLLFTDTHFRIRNDNGSMPVYEISELFQFTPAATLMGGYWYAKLSEQKFQNATLLFDYAISKRTDVYASGSYLHASGGAAPVFLGGGSAPIFLNGSLVGTGDSAKAIRVGMRTRF
ncbi:porin [uncultured Caballeronia sp.]|uniref:porin n=1 Tax=uncultured Caballeronia sp. TaxID=1827198 RepID=UPI0035C983F3